MGRSSSVIKVGAVLCGVVLTVGSALAKPRHPDVASLDKNSREIFLTAMRWGDESWDAQTMFLRGPQPFNVANPSETHATNHFMVRESSWYALGLLLRDQPGDRDRAAHILRAVL